MAKKPTITTVSSGYQSTTTINNNTQNLRDAFDNTLSLDGSTPNAMQADLDMNSNDILNASRVYTDGLYIGNQPVSPGNIDYNGVIKETKIATAGQTVFNLTNITYTPNINNLSVFINGVYKNKSFYIENSPTQVTFITPLTVGQIVDFVVLSVDTLSGTADATNLTYTSPGSGAVTRTIYSRLSDCISVKDFGAVGNGIADDTAAIQAALNSEKPLDWGGLTYRITNTVSRTYTSDIYWEGRNATILYDGSHVERAVLIQGGGINIVLNDLTFDGQKLCNTVLSILNDSDSYTNLTCNNIFVTRSKRLATFNGGEGMLVRGSYNQFSMNGGGASDCELPTGQGTSSVQGIAGIVAIFYSTTRYIKAMHVNNIRVEKVYSSDLTYQDDQDGVVYFTPTDGTLKVPSLFSCSASEFVNCYGRSIKTQCRDTFVQTSNFIRTEGLTSGRGNGEVDVQAGNGNFRDLTFSYSNGYEPGACVNVSTLPGQNGLLADGCIVVSDSVTTLSTFAGVFPRTTGLSSVNTIRNNKVFGAVKTFFSFLCNGDKNYAQINNNFVEEIVNGETSEKALVYVKISGTTSPYNAYVTAFDNVYAGADLPALVRDAIPGNSMPSVLSAWSNYGFQTSDVTKAPSASGLKTNAIARFSKMGGSSGSGYMLVDDFAIASGGTKVVAIPNNTRPAFVFILAQYDNLSYAFFANSSTGNASLSVGARFVLGNTTDPGSGVFRVWTSATNEITISNTDSSARAFSLFAMVTN